MNQQRVSRRELADFCRQFAAMQRANVNIIDVLNTLQEQTSNDWFAQVLTSVWQDVELGRSLASAFSRFPADFSPFFIRMVRQGEIEGVLDEVLLSLAQHLDRETEGLPLAARSGADMGAAVEQLRPLLFRLTVAAGTLALGMTTLWYLHILGYVARERLGPDILLLSGAAILFFALIFLRYKPGRVARCSFCGRTEPAAGEMIAGDGVYICESCISTSVRQLRRAQSDQPAGVALDGAAPPGRRVTPRRAPEEEGDKVVEL